jgi:hypothetical protein
MMLANNLRGVSNNFQGVANNFRGNPTVIGTKYGYALVFKSGHIFSITGPVPIGLEGNYNTSSMYLCYSGVFGVTRRTKVRKSIMTKYLKKVLSKIDTTLSPEKVCDILRTYC